MIPIPAAEEFLRIFKSKIGLRSAISPLGTEGTEKEVMIEFAKLHVKAALKNIADSYIYYLEGDEGSERLNEKRFFKEAYSLTNIK